MGRPGRRAAGRRAGRERRNRTRDIATLRRLAAATSRPRHRIHPAIEREEERAETQGSGSWIQRSRARGAGGACDQQLIGGQPEARLGLEDALLSHNAISRRGRRQYRGKPPRHVPWPCKLSDAPVVPNKWEAPAIERRLTAPCRCAAACGVRTLDVLCIVNGVGADGHLGCSQASLHVATEGCDHMQC